MSESSTESEVEDTGTFPETETQQEPKQVPVKAVQAERAKKRDAQAELAEEREKRKRDADISDAQMQAVLDKALETVKAELGPEREARMRAEKENSLLRMRVDHGLNDEQAEKVMELQSKNNLTPEQALVLLRAEDPDNFSPPVGRLAMGGLRPGGDSLSRNPPPKEDHMKRSNEAREKGDVSGAQYHAAQAFQQRFQVLFGRRAE